GKGQEPRRRRRRLPAGRRARIAGQDSPPTVEVRPGELTIAAKRIDRLTGPLPSIDQGSPGSDALGIVPGHEGVLPNEENSQITRRKASLHRTRTAHGVRQTGPPRSADLPNPRFGGGTPVTGQR